MQRRWRNTARRLWLQKTLQLPRAECLARPRGYSSLPRNQHWATRVSSSDYREIRQLGLLGLLASCVGLAAWDFQEST